MNVTAHLLASEPDVFPQCVHLICTFLNLVEHHSKEPTVHRFEPARPRNRAQHIAANTE